MGILKKVGTCLSLFFISVFSHFRYTVCMKEKEEEFFV
ncbi:hypothetical protein A0O32_2024 [Anoxybacillus flavithermus]|uniref:Uncharacterized protein n=1 Tax=Anoxybacillus flavithermus TaxID=33934 RepID=A0A178TBT8_9BACL|nr:hypothetical protein TAF16_2192 [Anoxybacillus flavithermus]OAO78833.1 hypothetical protein A0O32_2024 [Anoxybacillus flavithermus]